MTLINSVFGQTLIILKTKIINVITDFDMFKINLLNAKPFQIK